MLKSFFQSAELCLDCLRLLVLQGDNLTAIIADLLLLLVDGGLDPLKNVKEMVILVRQSTLVVNQLLVGLLNLVLRDLQLVLRGLQIVNDTRPNVADGGQRTVGTVHEVMMLSNPVSPNPLPAQRHIPQRSKIEALGEGDFP